MGQPEDHVANGGRTSSEPTSSALAISEPDADPRPSDQEGLSALTAPNST
jgi:hypothetical protein